MYFKYPPARLNYFCRDQLFFFFFLSIKPEMYKDSVDKKSGSNNADQLSSCASQMERRRVPTADMSSKGR